MAFVYSCCFWFSLRLGGIFIGIFSMVHGLIVLTAAGVAHTHPEHVKDTLTNWIGSLKLGYTKVYVESIRDDPDQYTTISIISPVLYIILCALFIYGAYTCNNKLMLGYIAVEGLRLLMMSALLVTCLLLLKQNTMDIGLVIGASVAGGFALLGMFYLWVCAANLPILINEMEREEQQKTIEQLRRQLDEKRARGFSYDVEDLPRFQNIANVDLFTAPAKTVNKNYSYKQIHHGSTRLK